MRGARYVRLIPWTLQSGSEQIVLALHKENERTGEARTTIRSTSPIVIEIAY
jgi:hypothetical protein